MARTTSTLVQAILLRDYDSRNSPSLTPFITSASVIVDRMVTCAALSGITFSDDELLEIEGWVAAYRYTHNNPVYSSKSTDGRSASFLREDSKNPYKLGALELDPSGCLNSLLDPKRKIQPGFSWLGKTESEQINYTERQ